MIARLLVVLLFALSLSADINRVRPAHEFTNLQQINLGIEIHEGILLNTVVRTVTSISLIAPTVDPNLIVGQQFTFTVQVNLTSDGSSDYDLHFQMNSGNGWFDMPTAGGIDYSVPAPNPLFNIVIAATSQQDSKTVTTNQACSVCLIRGFVVDHRNAEAQFFTVEQAVTASQPGGRTVSGVTIRDPGNSYDVFVGQVLSFRVEVSMTGAGLSDYDVQFQFDDGGGFTDMPTSGSLDLVAEGPPINPAVNWKVDQATKLHLRMVRVAQADTYSIRARVVDHINNEVVTTSLSRTVTATTYTGTITLPLPPADYVDLRFPDALSGVTTPVPSGGNLQTFLNNVNCGDTLLLEAGATFTGNFVLQRNECGCAADPTQFIMIRSDASDSNLPDQDERFNPTTHGSFVPIILTSGSQATLEADNNSSAASTVDCYYFFAIKFECTGSPTIENFWCVRLGDEGNTQVADEPQFIIFDRTWFHANELHSFRRALYIVAANHIGLINSYVDGWSSNSNDCQGVLIRMGFALHFENNFIDGAAEPIMAGGVRPKTNEVPSDILVLRSQHTHPNNWNPEDPAYDGRSRQVKNLFELKNARRVIVEGNVFHNNWSGSQGGHAVILSPRGESNTPWAEVRNVVMRFNKMFDLGRGFNQAGADNIDPSEPSEFIWWHDNLFYNIGQDPFNGDSSKDGGFIGSSTSNSSHVRFTHNTFSKVLRFGVFDVQAGCSFDVNFYEFSDNLFDVNSATLIGDTVGAGFPFINNCLDANSIVANNAIVNINSTETCNGSGGGLNDYPTNHFCLAGSAAVQFTDRVNDDYSLLGTSPLIAGGTDGKNVGANIAELVSKIAGVQQPTT